jgi:hypothetical protein
MGLVQTVSTPTKTDEQRVIEALDKCYENESGCWVYTGYILPSGYGQVGQNTKLHRATWEFFRAPIPTGLSLDHLCHDPLVCHPANEADCLHRRCANPWHTEPVTTRVNTLRGGGIVPTNLAKRFCPSGHEYTADNIYYRAGGTRRACRVCTLRRNRRDRHRRQAEARARRQEVAA